MKIGGIINYINIESNNRKSAVSFFNLPFKQEALRSRMKDAGYNYNKTLKQWLGGDPNFEIEDSITLLSNIDKSISPFTIEQINILKAIIDDYNKSEILNNKDNQMGGLYKRLNELSETSLRKETIHITETAITKINELSAQCHINRDSLISLAIIDFVEKHQKIKEDK